MFCECIDPIVAVEVMAVSIPAINQPLILQCTATIVRGINSTVDIIWTTGDRQVRRVNNVTANSYINSTFVYYDSFIIPSLNISDIGSVYQCEVLINSIVPTTANADFIITIPGTGGVAMCTCVAMCVYNVIILCSTHTYVCSFIIMLSTLLAIQNIQ